MRRKFNHFLSRFWTVTPKDVSIVAALVFSQIFYYVITVVSAMMISILLDWVIPDFSYSKMGIWIVMSTGFFLLERIMEGTLVGYLYFKYEILLTVRKNLDVMSHIIRKPVYETNRYNEGYLFNLFLSDSSEVVSVSVQMLVQIISIVLSLTITLACLWFISPVMCLIEALLIPVYIFLSVSHRKKLEEVQSELRNSRDQLHSTILNMLKNKKAIKLAKQDAYFEEELTRSRAPFIKWSLAYWKNFFFAEELPLVAVSLGNILLLSVGTFQYIHQDLSLGMLVFSGTVSSLVAEQVKALLTRFLRRIAAVQSFERVDHFYEKTAPETIAADFQGNEIHLTDTDLSIDGKLLYHIPEFHTGTSGLVMIQGANGTGKSTLFNWLLGIVEPTAGVSASPEHIRLPKDLFDRTNYLSSPDILLETTVRDNICLGREDLPRLKEITDMLGIDFLDKTVSIHPVNLSFGEQQKIFLARVLCGSGSILILDEPTTNLDLDTRQRLTSYLRQEKERRLIFLISHDEELEAIADQIYQIENQLLTSRK